MTTIGFIGGGKMAEALLRGIAADPNIRLSGVRIADADSQRRRYLQRNVRSLAGQRPVIITGDNQLAAARSDVLVLAVKPQHLLAVLREIEVRNGTVVISIAAGITLKTLEKFLKNCAVIRAMPNNPALVGEGMTALAKGKRVTGHELLVARKIFESVGEVVELDEKYLDAVTGLSGSGPAFVYLVTEALTEGGIAAGLPPKVAEKLAAQTVLGAAATVKRTARTPRELREMVTSPGGTTLEGLAVLEKRKMIQALRDAVVAAAKRSKALSRQWAR